MIIKHGETVGTINVQIYVGRMRTTSIINSNQRYYQRLGTWHLDEFLCVKPDLHNIEATCHVVDDEATHERNRSISERQNIYTGDATRGDFHVLKCSQESQGIVINSTLGTGSWEHCGNSGHRDPGYRFALFWELLGRHVRLALVRCYEWG